jgi:hypothetical protein
MHVTPTLNFALNFFNSNNVFGHFLVNDPTLPSSNQQTPPQAILPSQEDLFRYTKKIGLNKAKYFKMFREPSSHGLNLLLDAMQRCI